MKWIKHALVAFILILALAALLPVFFSLNDYIPQIEKEASFRLKDPVTIKSIRLSLLPLPNVSLQGITVGAEDVLVLDEVRITPDLFSFMRPLKVINNIEVSNLRLGQKAISRIPVWITPDAEANTASSLLVRQLRIIGARADLGMMKLGPFDAHVYFDGQSAPEKAWLGTQDGKLNAKVTAEKSAYQFEIQAESWTLPAGPSLIFDKLHIQGEATAEEARLEAIKATLYNGTATGKLKLNWRKGWRLNGNFDINRLELARVISMLSPSTHLSGHLDSKPVFSATAASASQLLDDLRLDAPFTITDGVLGGVDIQKAATGMKRQEASGGETRFEHLSGNLNMDREGYHFRQLKIQSGSFIVDGNVDVSKKMQLSGRINAQLASLSVPLNVSGTVSSPSLYPTGATMTGAAIGTVILGPGLGTSVGAKAGGWVEKLFGGNQKKKEEQKPAQ